MDLLSVFLAHPGLTSGANEWRRFATQTRVDCGRLWLCRFPGRGGWRRCRLRRLACRKRHFAALLLRARARGFSRGRLGGGLRGRWGWIRGNLFFRRLGRRLRKWLGWRRLGLLLLGSDRRVLSADFVVRVRGRG